jgi:hypothetical protein
MARQITCSKQKVVRLYVIMNKATLVKDLKLVNDLNANLYRCLYRELFVL